VLSVEPGFVPGFSLPNIQLLKNFFQKYLQKQKTRVYLPTQNNNIMTPNQITPELVQTMYIATPNKARFLQIFGTKKFNVCREDLLVRMFNYLESKNK
jgi:hypothetical protein